MGVTTGSPSEIFIGAPGQVKFGGSDIGATTEGITVRIVPSAITTPQINGVPGLLAKTDYTTTEECSVEVTMLELSKANLRRILAGSTESPTNVITRLGKRRYPSSMYSDLVIALAGLDDARLVFIFPNVTPTSGLEVTAGDDQAAAPSVTFEGRYRAGSDYWRIVRKDVTTTDLEWVAPSPFPSALSLKVGVPATVGFRAVQWDGKPVVYGMTPVPAGMVFDNATGTLSGTPTTAGGPTACTVTANDASAPVLSNVVNITVAA